MLAEIEIEIGIAIAVVALALAGSLVILIRTGSKWTRRELIRKLGREPTKEEFELRMEEHADFVAEWGDKAKCLFCGRRLKPGWQACRACGRAQPQTGWGRTHRLVGGELVSKEALRGRPTMLDGNASLREPTTASPEVTADLASRLERLTDLHRSGALTEREFAAAKSLLLREGSQTTPVSLDDPADE